jgi:hypothetical protein
MTIPVTTPKRHSKHFQPEVEYPPIERVAGGQPRALDGRKPRRQPDGERRENNVKRDHKPELKAREESRIKFHDRVPQWVVEPSRSEQSAKSARW